MEVFNRLKTSMSGALPGNPVTREYDIGKQVGSAGPGLLWKVYEGIKKSTKQDACVWLLEKRLLDNYSKNDREAILSACKKGVAQLTRLRHPKILSVVHPLEESRDSLGFATEPVYASLANVLGYHDNLPDALIKNLKEHQLFETEIKYGTLQIAEGLAFLHGDCRQLHNNLCPESVVINRAGAWKLAGFDFSVISASSTADAEVIFSVIEWQANFPHLAQPRLNYMSPEVALQGRATVSSDLFSLGCLIYSVYNKGRGLFDSRNELSAYRKNADQLKTMRVGILQSLPENLRDYVKLMLNYEATVRPDADQFTKIPYFEDPGVITLQHMDNLYQLDNLAKSKFYKALPKTITALPKRISLHRIFPQLAEEFVNPNMVPFVLPSVLQIADLITEEEFGKTIMPRLIPVFKMSEPLQITLICLQNLNILMAKCPQQEFKNYVLPMMNRALEADNNQTQELCLSILPTIAHLMDYSTLKNSVVPRIKKLCLSTGMLAVRVNCLICIGKLMEHMDKWFVLDDILPVLAEIRSKEPAVLMSILGIYRVAFSHKRLGITKEILATRALPFLLPLAVDGNLSLGQFLAFMHLVKEMIAKVESEHRNKLEQLHSLQQEQKTLQFSQDSQFLENGHGSQNESSMMDRFLSGFGLAATGGNSGDGNGKKKSELSSASILSTSSTVLTGSIVATDEPCAAAEVPQMTRPSLTLEEKQRLAAQQDQMTRFKSQPSLQPMGSGAQTKPKHQPKDLTSTLMERNLQSMAITQPRPSLTNTTQIPWQSAGPQPNYNSSFAVPTRPAMQMAAPSLAWGGTPMQQKQQQAPVNMAAFDSLFGPPQAKTSLNQLRPSVPMNQMGTAPIRAAVPFGNPPASTLPHPGSGQSTLTSNDIDDLLG